MRTDYMKLLIAAKEKYPQKTTVNNGLYKTKVRGEIRWNKELTAIVCDSSPLYYAKEERWVEN